MHHYPHHIGDYRAHTAHLSILEDGAYRRLLDLYYMHEKPLAADVAVVVRLAGARTEDESAAAERVLREFFKLEADGWHQKRADDEIAAYKARADKARENGKRSGGRPKTKEQTGTEPTGKPRDNRPGYSSDTQTEPRRKLTVNREPVGKAPTGLSPEEQTSSLVAARGALVAPAHDGEWPEIPKFLKRMPN